MAGEESPATLPTIVDAAPCLQIATDQDYCHPITQSVLLCPARGATMGCHARRERGEGGVGEKGQAGAGHSGRRSYDDDALFILCAVPFYAAYHAVPCPCSCHRASCEGR